MDCTHTQEHLNALCSSLCGANGRKLNPLVQAININEGTPPQGVRRSNRNRGRNRADETSERRLAAILDPSNWDKKSNILINKWCQNINRLVHNAILTRNQPALAEIINSEVSNYIHGDERPLNDNVIGKIFDITFHGGNAKGTWRIRAQDYDPLTGNFVVNTTGLDLGELNEIDNRYPVGWFTWTDVDLNGWLEDRNLVYIPEEDTVIFEESKLHDIYRNKNIFQEEVGGRDIHINIDGNWTDCTILHYNAPTRTHTLHDLTRGTDVQRDLNADWREGRMRPPHYLAPLLSHLDKIPAPLGAREADAARYGRSP